MRATEQIHEIGRAGRRRGHRRSAGRSMRGIAGRAGLLIAGLLLGAATPVRAQTLTQALAEAYNTNPQLLAQRALLRDTDEQVPQALSGWRPTVNFPGQVGGARGSFFSAAAVPGTPHT
ncbi:MAG: hypothetical protein ACREEZ_00880, partial [Stellaceae bacterium]